jgi:hypothetical protein
MQRSLGLAGIVVLLAAACSSTSASPPPASDAGAGGGGGTCGAYGATIAKNAPGCDGIPDVAGVFSASCKAGLDAVKTCKTEYEAFLACEASGSRCEGGKIVLGTCAAEAAAQAQCEKPVVVVDAAVDSAPTFSLVGAWTMTRVEAGSGAAHTYRVVFAGGESAGTAAFTVNAANLATGCKSTAKISTTFAFTAPASSADLGKLELPVPPAGTEDIADCTDGSGNGTGLPLDTGDLAAYTAGVNGELAIQSPTSFRLSMGGEDIRTFTRE